MGGRTLGSRVLGILGLLAMLVGAVDPLEGLAIILPGSGLVALGAYLGRSRFRRLLTWAFVLVAFGVGAMIAISQWGGLGGRSGHSWWWGLWILPYPIGWLLGLVGGVRRLIEAFQRQPTGQNSDTVTAR